MIDFEKTGAEKTGERAGFFFSYCIFTIMTYLVFNNSGKVPDLFSLVCFATVTIGVTIMGLGFERWFNEGVFSRI